MQHAELVNILKNSNGALPVGILAVTDAKALKTGNPFGTILKTVRAVGWVGAKYENAVNREGVRQGVDAEFVAAPLPWGDWLVKNKVITHKGEFYLRTQSTPGGRKRQAAKVLAYRGENGQYLSREQVAPFLPKTRESAKQQEAGLEETIFVRTYKLNSIKRIRIGGKTHDLVP